MSVNFTVNLDSLSSTLLGVYVQVRGSPDVLSLEYSSPVLLHPTTPRQTCTCVHVVGCAASTHARIVLPWRRKSNVHEVTVKMNRPEVLGCMYPLGVCRSEVVALHVHVLAGHWDFNI